MGPGRSQYIPKCDDQSEYALKDSLNSIGDKIMNMHSNVLHSHLLYLSRWPDSRIRQGYDHVSGCYTRLSLG